MHRFTILVGLSLVILMLLGAFQIAPLNIQPLTSPAHATTYTVTLRPNGPGDLTQLSRTGASSNWAAVADTTADGDGSYVVKTAGGGGYYDGYDLYTLQTASLSGYFISSVAVYWVSASLNAHFTYIKTHGTTYQGPVYADTCDPYCHTWRTRSTTYSSNPYTGAPWTSDEINALQVGVFLQAYMNINGEADGYCTQEYVVVTYTENYYFTITNYPSSVFVGQNFAGIVVTVYNTATSTVKTDYTGQAYFTSTDPLASLPYTSSSMYTFTTGTGGDNGIHTFVGFTLNTAGSQTITVMDASSNSKQSSAITVLTGTVTTQYLTSTSITANGLTSKLLSTTESTTYEVGSGGASGGWSGTFYVGIRVYKRTSAGTETEITTTYVALAPLGTGLTATYTPPGTSLAYTDSIIIRVYFCKGNAWLSTQTSWQTGPLGASYLNATTWTITYAYTYYSVNWNNGVITFYLYYGSPTYLTRIANFVYTPITTRFSNNIGADVGTTPVVNINVINYAQSSLPYLMWMQTMTYTFAQVVPSTTAGKQYVLTGVSGGSPAQNGATGTYTPTLAGTITATYKVQYLLIMMLNPPFFSSSSITPAAGIYWKDAASQVAISANTVNEYTFSSWTGSGLGSYSGNNAGTTITMNSPVIETANFASSAPSSISVTVTSYPPAGSGFIKVDDTTYDAPHTFTWTVGSTHKLEAITPVSCGVGCQYVFTQWSDGTTTPVYASYTTPSSTATITAIYKTQYQIRIGPQLIGALMLVPLTPLSVFKSYIIRAHHDFCHRASTSA